MVSRLNVTIKGLSTASNIVLNNKTFVSVCFVYSVSSKLVFKKQKLLIVAFNEGMNMNVLFRSQPECMDTNEGGCTSEYLMCNIV